MLRTPVDMRALWVDTEQSLADLDKAIKPLYFKCIVLQMKNTSKHRKWGEKVVIKKKRCKFKGDTYVGHCSFDLM